MIDTLTASKGNGTWAFPEMIRLWFLRVMSLPARSPLYLFALLSSYSMRLVMRR